MSDWKDYLAGRYRAHPDQTPEQHAWQVNHYKQRETFLRWFSNCFELWRGCTDKRCRRARACSGDPRCASEFVLGLPPAQRLWLQRAIKARVGGASAQEAGRMADAAWAEHERAMRELAARFGGSATTPASEEPSSSAGGGG